MLLPVGMARMDPIPSLPAGGPEGLGVEQWSPFWLYLEPQSQLETSLVVPIWRQLEIHIGNGRDAWEFHPFLSGWDWGSRYVICGNMTPGETRSMMVDVDLSPWVDSGGVPGSSLLLDLTCTWISVHPQTPEKNSLGSRRNRRLRFSWVSFTFQGRYMYRFIQFVHLKCSQSSTCLRSI